MVSYLADREVVCPTNPQKSKDFVPHDGGSQADVADVYRVPPSDNFKLTSSVCTTEQNESNLMRM